MTAERLPPGSWISAIVIGAIVWNAAAFGEELSQQERFGRRIYMDGQGAAPIEALLGNGETSVAASVVPCASCHGADGRGRPEGGVIPSDITMAMLTAPLDAGGTTGSRKRDPYTERSIKRAISMGLDASGNRLNATMPRYRMSSQDMDALMSYLKKVGQVADPGVTADAILIGALLPPKSHLPGVYDAVRHSLQAFVDARNRAGEIYGRKLELVFADCEGSPSARAAAAEAFVREKKPFALVGSFTDGADEEIAAVAEEQRIPLLATISSHARSDGSRRYVRHLVAGVYDQTRALAQSIGRNFPKAHVAVLHGSEERSKAIAEAGARELRKIGIDVRLAETSIATRTLKEDGVDVVLYAGPRDALPKLVAAMRELEWSPAIFVSSALIHPAALDGSRSSARFYIALPIAPEDQAPEAVTAWRKLVGEKGTRLHQPSQFAALASAQLLVAALERAGRDVTRDGLLAALDGIVALETGLVPPLTYTPSRHIGSTGAYIVAISDERREIVWIDPG